VHQNEFVFRSGQLLGGIQVRAPIDGLFLGPSQLANAKARSQNKRGNKGRRFHGDVRPWNSDVSILLSTGELGGVDKIFRLLQKVWIFGLSNGDGRINLGKVREIAKNRIDRLHSFGNTSTIFREFSQVLSGGIFHLISLLTGWSQRLCMRLKPPRSRQA
jgi:hypothetical protein